MPNMRCFAAKLSCQSGLSCWCVFYLHVSLILISSHFCLTVTDYFIWVKKHTWNRKALADIGFSCFRSIRQYARHFSHFQEYFSPEIAHFLLRINLWSLQLQKFCETSFKTKKNSCHECFFCFFEQEQIKSKPFFFLVTWFWDEYDSHLLCTLTFV